jgi:hypothetical protein
MANIDPSDVDRGLYEKFHVYRTDGRSCIGQKHHGCEYFVLDLTHDPFANAALDAYAKACRSKFPKLADDIEAGIVKRTMQPLPDRREKPDDNNGPPSDARSISRAEFDNICFAQGFRYGPFMSSFGDGPGEPYVPLSQRTVWGILKTGETVVSRP